MARRFIVVPESFESRDGQRIGPSFVYRQVLDWIAANSVADDAVYLAPANSFGGPKTEEEVAEEYLRPLAAAAVFCPGRNLMPYSPDGRYVDTWGNAARLAPLIDLADDYELVVAELHARRAAWCFRRRGFRIREVIAVPHRVLPGGVIPRNFYYKSRFTHWLYEWAAYARDRIVYL